MKLPIRALTVVTFAVIASIVVGVVWLVSAGAFSSVAGRSYKVSVLVPQASSLGAGSRVRIAGVEVGRVEGIRRASDGAMVRLSIDDDHAPLPRDTRFGVQLHTLVGENYIELRPGSSRTTVPSGGILPMAQADDYVEADTILSTLQGRTQQRARRLLRATGDGLGGRGKELNHLLESAGGIVTSASPLAVVLDQRRQDIAKLVDGLDGTMAAVASRGSATKALASTFITTARSIADRDDAVRSTLDALPPTLSRVRSTTATVRRTTADVAPVLTDVADVVRTAKSTVELLRPAAQDGRSLIAELDRAAPRLQGTLTRARTLSPVASAALPPVRRTLCQLNPALGFLKPYAPEIGALIQNLGSVTNFYDLVGHGARLAPTVNPINAGLFGTPQPVTELIKQLVSKGILGEAVSSGYNPLPPPGNPIDATIGRGVTGPADVKQRYPRVEAAC